MNIRELLDWRTKCFLCEEELEVFPEITGNIGKFSIEDDWMIVTSRFIKFSVHTITGEIAEPEGQKETIDQFISSRSLTIKCQCLNCNHNGRFYQYTGRVTLIPFTARSSCVSDLEEMLLMDNGYMLTQHWDLGVSFIYLDLANGTSKPAAKKYEYPLFDLKKLNPEQLKNKLKTYVVFS